MENMSEWIFDAQFPNSKMGYKIKQELVKRTTPHQELAIYDTYDFGKMLVLDGIVQTTEKDEFIYHEMMAHVAAFCHPHPKQVLVIGGGNGGVVREFLKHKEIDRVVLCEVDAILIQECKTHLPEIAGALGDKRCEVFNGDGIQYVLQHKNEFDIILVDTTDPFASAEGLFGGSFYENLRDCLTHDGIFVAQSETPFLLPEIVNRVFKDCKNFFPIAKLYTMTVPTYPGGICTVTIASKRYDPARPYNSDRPAFPLRYYSKDHHRAAFVHPQYVEDILAK